MRKLSLSLAIFLYIIFIIEAITGYWVQKPREIGNLLLNFLDRRDAYVLHGYILPILLYGLIFFHTTLTLKKFFNFKIILALNTLIFLFFLFLHLI
jgi:hypothetical protein